MNDDRDMRAAESEKPMEQGFSFVELAVTVSLLGIAFLLTLQGASLVESVRAFMTAYQIEHFQNDVMVYRTENGFFPGDDPNAAKRFNRDDAITMVGGASISYVGDETINGKLSDALNPNSETFMAWRDLRYAGLIEGDPKIAGASTMPENKFGGVFGFDEGNLGQKGASLCVTKIPGRAAEMIDRRLDDGVINKGRIVATSKYDVPGAFNHFDAPDAEPYNFEKEYIICAPILP